MEETDRRIGKLGNRFGELAEHLVTPNIAGKFRTLGYAFTRTGLDVEFLNRDGTPLTEVDLWLENGEFVMAVEVKSRLRREYVDDHVRRMAMLRSYFDERGDTRKLLGAAAGAIVPQELKRYVRRKGLYLIEQSGDTVRIDVPRGFTPRIW
jgi:Holliday junction resolvase-like predicted endonuclease